jgi:DNA mismatch repair protein MutS2
MVTLEPKDIYSSLEFDKVLELVAERSLGELGRERISTIAPLTDKDTIERMLDEVNEYCIAIGENDHFPVHAYSDIKEDLKMLSLENFVLPIDGLQRIHKVLLFMRDAFRFFNKGRQEAYPTLYEIVRKIDFDKELIAAIDRVVDDEGNIKSDASPELMRIKRMQGSKQKELDRKFRIIINDFKKKGWLTDNVESFRNGRRVLSVPAEHKRKLRGIIHDESTTGKTAFIEPDGVIDINNDIFDLETEEKKEIYRILKDLSELLRPYGEHMQIYLETLIHYDIIQAKAKVADLMNAGKPKLKNKPHLGLIKAFHPLLYLKNKGLGKETIPFDMSLFPPNKILVLSGPNAGGKSITMKTAGLIQMMMQSGLLVPVNPASEMGIFKQIFADIGDQQSLEDDLSTYSSRLANARLFIEKGNSETLIVIDEFGSGTDPKIGGAIAEAVLRELNFKKTFGVITTHYSNLKIFAFKTKGLLNAAMTFDKETLSPTYNLKIGRPGSSYAFEIAQKSNLNKKVLNYARHRAGENEKAVDELLVDLQQEKKEAEDHIKDLMEKQKNLEKLIKNYDSLHRDLEFRRKKIKLETKENALQNAAQNNKEMERVVREIKEQQNLEKAKKVAAEIKEERKDLVKEVTELKEDIYYKPVTSAKQEEREIIEGDFVKFKTGGATGVVESLNKKKAVVQIGDMRMTINLRDLQLANEPLDIRSTRSIKTSTAILSGGFDGKLDIRGMTIDEAMKVVEAFVDQGLMANATHLRIVHGKGTGALRNVVRKKLREYNTPMNIGHPAHDAGGDGVTEVELM